MNIGGKWKKFVGGWDIHGDKQSPDANRVFFKFIDDFKPDIRICGGDVWDFRPLRKKASEEEKRESMVTDFKAGKRWLEQFKPDYFLRGNHDERLWELAEKDCGVMSDYAYDGIGEITALLKHFNCRMLPYHKRDGVLRLGSLKCIHGFHVGVYASRQVALIYGSCLFGHTHALDEHAIPGLERRVARNVGCLCELDLDYASRMPNTLKQAHGFPFGVVNRKTGAYHMFQAEEIDGKWIIPSDVKIYK